ncbi:MAG TPA: hypothetical protein DCZ05_13765, partial [Deltaproteobacteria bacterium]|nr:hypothetical protein [Deltaproteobacteria bacterium]
MHFQVVHSHLDKSLAHPARIGRVGRHHMVRGGGLTVKTAAGAKNPWTGNFAQGNGIPLRHDPVQGVTKIPDRGDAVSEEQLSAENTVMDMVIDKSGKYRLTTRVDGPSLFRHIHLAGIHPRD